MIHEVSVVISLYNKIQYIERALDLVIVQTIQDFDLIVIDNGLSDVGEIEQNGGLKYSRPEKYIKPIMQLTSNSTEWRK